MHVCLIRFSLPEGLDPDLPLDLLNSYLAALRMNGQVLGRDWPIYQQDDALETRIMTPEANSLTEEWHGKYPGEYLRKAREKGIRVERHPVAAEAYGADCCVCTDSGGYLLFTNYLRTESPVSCLDCFQPVPLYKLPYVSGDEHHEIISWQSDYQSCDSLQMNCSVLERSATRQMSHPSSELSRLGQTICDTLAEKMAKPFYYYLYRDKGRSLKAEMARTCPVCGTNWHLEKRLHSLFDFKCDHCRLLSNIAFALPR